MMGLEKSLWLIQYTLLQIFTYFLITQWMFNENKQESRARGRKFLFLIVLGILKENIEFGITKMFFFFICFLSRQSSECSAASRLFKKKDEKIICGDNQKGVFCFTDNEQCNVHSTNQKSPPWPEGPTCALSYPGEHRVVSHGGVMDISLFQNYISHKSEPWFL